jgi:transcriptional regulator with XRE-family HTH domain/DNA-binding CsgD family transcriptional regulator
LRNLRRGAGLTQLDLALSAGISSRHLSFLETGRARPSRDMVLRLGRVLACSLEERDTLLLAAGLAPAERPSPRRRDGLPITLRNAVGGALAVQEARSAEAAFEAARPFLADLGLSHFFAGVMRPAQPDAEPEISFRVGGAPPLAWLAHYHARGFRPDDPFVAATGTARRPFLWAEVIAVSPRPVRRVRQILQEAAEFRITGGYVVPLRFADGTVHAVSAMGQRVEAGNPAMRIAARLVCTTLLETLDALEAPVAARWPPHLDVRTADILRWSNLGHGAPWIAARLGLAEDEARRLLAQACLSLGVADICHAAARARRHGLIPSE